MELLFLIGVAWACSRAIEGLRKPASARWAKHQKARAARDTSPAGRAKARAARAAVTGFWAGEIAHGLPHARHGWTQGWAEHREQVTQRERERARTALQRERDSAQQDADDATWWNRTRAELAAHKHRLEVARREAEREPTMSEQLTADIASRQRQNGDHPMRSENCTNPDCSCHAADPPLADGSTPGNGAPHPSPNGHKAPATGGNVSGDMNYDTAVETSDKLVAAAEQAANDEALGIATTMADELGGMTPDDSTLLGLASEVVTAAARVRDGARELQEKAAAMNDHLVKNYGPIQEAVDSGPGTAPEKQFVNH